MTDLDKAFAELRSRVRDIPIHEALAQYASTASSGSLKRQVTDMLDVVLRIYREAIFERMDDVLEDFR